MGFEDSGVVCGGDGAVQEEQRGKKNMGLLILFIV